MGQNNTLGHLQKSARSGHFPDIRGPQIIFYKVISQRITPQIAILRVTQPINVLNAALVLEFANLALV